MSNLALGDDDFPAAAKKMIRDATVLHENVRYDGAAYLAGYVVETSLKTVLLLEALASIAGVRTLPDLAKELAVHGSVSALLAAYGGALVPEGLSEALRKQVSHNTKKIVQGALAKGGVVLKVPLVASSVTRCYLSPSWERLVTHRGWRPEHRYRAEGTVDARRSRQRLRNATVVMERTIQAMVRDGVIV